MKASSNFYKLVKTSESLHDGDLTIIGCQPKLCPAGKWTVGYGHNLNYDSSYSMEDIFNIFPQYKSLSEADAMKILISDTISREQQLNTLLSVCDREFTQGEFDALLDFVFNFSDNKLAGSTLFYRVRNGGNIYEAFLMWNKMRVRGELVVAKGLTIRREREAHLYLTGELNF